MEQPVKGPNIKLVFWYPYLPIHQTEVTDVGSDLQHMITRMNVSPEYAADIWLPPTQRTAAMSWMRSMSFQAHLPAPRAKMRRQASVRRLEPHCVAERNSIAHDDPVPQV